jgi:hypothetical protein
MVKCSGQMPRSFSTRRLRTLLLVVALGAMGALAQTETYRIQLAPVAADLAMRENITGSGNGTAILVGTKLTLNGTFDGLKGNATVAYIHQGSATGVRGPELLALTVMKAMKGSVSGSFNLTPEQIDALRKGRWYVQIHSEKAPEGNLWGWLLK